MNGFFPLAGMGVLVTRPAHQATRLCRLLEDQGAISFSFPVIEIIDPEDTIAPQAALTRLRQFDLAIFVSPNAVIRAWRWISVAGGLPPGLTIAAVGQGTAHELQRLGRQADLVPEERFDSEALLALPRLTTMKGQRVIIFRGVGGRELLTDELTRRGASVTNVEVYRRIKPNTDPSELLRRLACNEIHVAVVTSAEGLRNLLDLVGPVGQDWLRDTQLVLFSERAVTLARELGLRGTIFVAKKATDAAVVEIIMLNRYHFQR
ncbi:Uroporphyrinogen-III synthase [Gammaproteobacteria bacterium]